MDKRILKKSQIRFIEENKEIIKLISRYGNPPTRELAETLLIAYRKDKRRR